MLYELQGNAIHVTKSVLYCVVQWYQVFTDYTEFYERNRIKLGSTIYLNDRIAQRYKTLCHSGITCTTHNVQFKGPLH